MVQLVSFCLLLRIFYRINLLLICCVRGVTVWKAWQIFLNLKLHQMSQNINKINFPYVCSVSMEEIAYLEKFIFPINFFNFMGKNFS